MPTLFRTLGEISPTSTVPGANGHIFGNGSNHVPSVADAPPAAIDSGAESPRNGYQVVPQVPPIDANEDRHASSLHQVIKNTDYWFNFELSRLEKYAVESAGLHAQANLPRQNVPAVEELPIETTLRARATELFIEWAARVRRKLQDEIQGACLAAREGVNSLRHALAQFELSYRDIRGMEAKLRGRASSNPREAKTVEYGPLLRRWSYRLLLAGLVIVDWVANVPVFTELLPKEQGSEQRWQDIVASSEQYGWLAGVHTLFNRILFSPEVSLLCLGVIVFLMALCHFLGTSVRRLIAYKPHDEPTLAPALHSHRRQAWFPFAASIIGISLVLSFLFFSRGEIDSMTRSRLTEAKEQVTELEQDSVAAKARNDFSADEAIQLQLVDARAIAAERKKSAVYASGISSMNFPILLLNLTLVITATVASYLESDGRVIDTPLGDAGGMGLEGRLKSLRLEALTQKQRLRSLESEIDANISKAKFLARALPLGNWEAKAQRLEGVIPLFRAENARQRGIDVQNILGFQQQAQLQLPTFSSDEPMRLPDELLELEGDFARIRVQVEALNARISAPSINGYSA